MSFVFTADTHLCSYNVKKHRNMRGDSLHSFRQIARFCRKEELPLVIGGDVFDSPRPDPETVSGFLDAIHGLTVYYVTGQHDGRGAPWPSLHNLAFRLDQKRYTIGDIAITGLDWRPGSEVVEATKSLPESDVFVGHQVWREFNYGVAELSFQQLPEWTKLALVGDYHIPWDKYFNPRPLLRVVSPGSISMMSIDEPPDKYFYVVDDDLRIESKKLETRPAIMKSIEVVEDIQMVEPIVESAAIGNFDRAMLHITYNPGINDIVKRLRSVFAGKTYLWLKPIKREESQSEKEASINVEDKSDLIKKAISTSLDGEERDIAMKLWNTSSIEEELHDICGGLA